MGNTHPSKDGIIEINVHAKNSHKSDPYLKPVLSMSSATESDLISWDTINTVTGEPKPRVNNKAPPVVEGTVGHITDRMDQVNFTASTDDLLRTVNDKGQTYISNRRRQSIHVVERTRLKSTSQTTNKVQMTKQNRVNSCGTLFVDSTVVAQNFEQTLSRFGSILWELIAHGHSIEDPLHDEIFDETVHAITRSSSLVDPSVVPSEREIQKFLKLLFQSAQLCAESAIIALIYVHRLVGMAGIALHATNWRRVALGSVALASKVWDDQAVWNIDYCNFLTMISVDNMNELERRFLLFLQFNVSVEPSLYAKYYFDLRSLAIAEDFSAAPLDSKTAKRFHIACSTETGVENISVRSKSAEMLSFKPPKAFL